MRTKDETVMRSVYRNGKFVNTKEYLAKETITCDICRNEFEPKDIIHGMCIKCSENLILLKDKHIQELRSMSKDDLINLIIQLEDGDESEY